MALGSRMETDNFFKVKYRKVFGIKDRGISDSIDTFDTIDMQDAFGADSLVARLSIQNRYSMARLVAGVVLDTIIKEGEAQSASRLLWTRYNDELVQSQLYINKAIELLRVSEHTLPMDMIPTTARGYLKPLEPSIVEKLLYGSLRTV